MGIEALSFLVDDPGMDGGAAVLSRGNATWNGQGERFGDEVRGLAAGLVGYGLSAGARAAVLGPESRETLRAGLAVISTGATLVPLDPSLPDDGLRRALASTGAVQVIASDERQLARVLALRPDLSALELVLLTSAAPSERRPAAMLVDEAIVVGLAGLVTDPGRLRRAFAEGQGHSACLLIEGSGRISEVGRVNLSSLSDLIARDLGLTQGKTVFAALPVGGAVRLAASLAALSRGATLLLPDPDERPDAGLAQFPVDAALLDVSGLERVFRAWSEDIEAQSWLGRTTTRWALREGRKAERSGWRHGLADRIALRELRGKLGGKATGLDVIVSGGRTASAEASAFFLAAGLPVRFHSPDTGAVLAR